MSQLYMTNYTVATAVTPGDSTAVVYTGLYVGGTGNVAVRVKASGASVTFQAVPAGMILPLEIDRVLSTGTTATLMVGLA